MLGSNLVTDRHTNSLTPYTGVCGFFLIVKFATSLCRLAGGLLSDKNTHTFRSIDPKDGTQQGSKPGRSLWQEDLHENPRK